MSLGLFGFNLVNNFYYTNLIAMGRQVEQNLRWVSFVLLKNVLALTMVIFISNLPEIYFLAFLLVTGLELWMNSKTAQVPLTAFCRWADIISVLRQSGLISLAIGLGILVFSLDRLVMPSLMTLEAFGVYSAVVTVGLYFLQLQYPITKALFPAFAKKINLNPQSAGAAMWQQAFILGGMLAPLLLIAALCADQILGFYSVPKVYLEKARWLFHGILFAVLINAIYHGIYMRLVVEGRGRLIAFINFSTLVVVLSILISLGEAAPFVAGALAWCSISGIQLLGSTVFYRWLKHAI
jgi:O-antigen/teichoic acid export membrane protein